MALLLTQLLKISSTWQGGEALPEDAVKAFHDLKGSLMKCILLYYVKPKVPFVHDVDVSQTMIGACLLQEQDSLKVPLAFCSKTLGQSRQKYCTTKRELYACIYATMYFRGFISGEDVTIHMDHSALK